MTTLEPTTTRDQHPWPLIVGLFGTAVACIAALVAQYGSPVEGETAFYVWVAAIVIQVGSLVLALIGRASA